MSLQENKMKKHKANKNLVKKLSSHISTIGDVADSLHHGLTGKMLTKRGFELHVANAVCELGTAIDNLRDAMLDIEDGE